MTKKDYSKYSNKLKNIIKYTKRKSDKEQVLKIGKDSKQIWNFVKSKINASTIKNNKIKILVEKNINIDNDKDKANTFNEYYGSIGYKLANNLK